MTLNRSSGTILGKLVIATTLLAVLGFLAGCSGAGTPMTMKEPDPEPLPTLLGTWQTTDTWHGFFQDEDGTTTYEGMVTDTITLTFTKSRFVQHIRSVLEDGRVSNWTESGTWTSTDTTVTKIDHIWMEDFTMSEEPVSVVKEYAWGDDERNTLFVHPWTDNQPTESFQRYTRLEPIPGGVTGVWHAIDHTTRLFTVDGEEVLRNRILTIGDTFIDNYSAVPAERTYILTGDLKRHDSDEGFLFVAVTGVEGALAPNDIYVEHEVRYAYAQIGPNTIVVSTFSYELEFNEDDMMWVDRTDPDGAFGAYEVVLEKQE